MPGFCLEAKQLFLTYPTTHLEPSEAWKQLQTIFGAKNWEVEEYLVAREFHEDGTPHLHCFIKFQLEGKQRRKIRDAHMLDLQENDEAKTWRHGSYEAAKNAQKSIKYCTKDADKEGFLIETNLDWKEKRKDPPEKKSKKELIAEKMVLEAKKPKDLVNEYPSMIYDYDRLVSNYKQWQADLLPEITLPAFLKNPWNILLPVDLKRKKCHYWIWSEGPDYYKTYGFAEPLAKYYKAVIQTEFAYWNIEPNTKIIILDDFNSQGLKYNQLNTLADGHYDFRVFHQGLKKLEEKALIIILSNKPIHEMYPIKTDLLEARYQEIQLTVRPNKADVEQYLLNYDK